VFQVSSVLLVKLRDHIAFALAAMAIVGATLFAHAGHATDAPAPPAIYEN
jgi:hypothetical protein